MRLGGEVAAAEQLADQDRKPDLDLVDPRGVLGREVEGDPMIGVTQERLACRHRLENAGFSLLAEVMFDATEFCDQAGHAFSDMWVLRLSQTTSHRAVGGAEANSVSRN